MTYSLELGPEGSPNQTFEADGLSMIDIAKPHTALADFDAEVPYDRSVQDRALDRVRIYADGTLLFRGYLREMDWDEKRGVTRINGPGIGDDLRDSAIERSWTDTATWEAIRQVWNQDTNFDFTVFKPSASEVVTDDVLVNASTDADLQAALGLPATDPVYVDGGDVKLAQSLFILEDRFGTGETLEPEASGEVESVTNNEGQVPIGYLGGDFGSSGDQISGSFTLNYDIPAGDVQWFMRHFPYDNSGDGNVNDLPGLDIRIDGSTVYSFGDGWGSFSPGTPRYRDGGGTGNGLSAGQHTMSIVQTANSDSSYDESGIGIFGVYDSRFSYNFDNSVSNSGNDTAGTFNYLDGPELYPDGFTARADQIDTDFNVIGATVTTGGWSDTTGAQSVGVSLDGGSTWTDNANATSVDVDQPSNVSGTVDWRFTMDRYGSGQQRTPDQGFNGQSFGSVTVDYDGSDLSIIKDNTFRGSPLRILTDLHDRAGMRFVIDHANTDQGGNLQKYAESFKRGDITKAKNWTVVNRRPSLSFVRYANEVTVYGALSGGTRPKVTVEDSNEVTNWGREPYFEVRPDLSTVAQLRAAAIDVLSSKVGERDQKGDVTVLPTDVLPGYSYPVDWFADGSTTDTPMERVQFSEGADRMRGTLKFKFEDDVTGTVIDQGQAIDVTREGI